MQFSILKVIISVFRQGDIIDNHIERGPLWMWNMLGYAKTSGQHFLS